MASQSYISILILLVILYNIINCQTDNVVPQYLIPRINIRTNINPYHPYNRFRYPVIKGKRLINKGCVLYSLFTVGKYSLFYNLLYFNNFLGWECPKYSEYCDNNYFHGIVQMCSSDYICNSFNVRRKCCVHPCYNFPICQLAVPIKEEIKRTKYISYPLTTFTETDNGTKKVSEEESETEQRHFVVVNDTEITIDARIKPE